jgi:hypothetical protein
VTEVNPDLDMTTPYAAPEFFYVSSLVCVKYQGRLGSSYIGFAVRNATAFAFTIRFFEPASSFSIGLRGLEKCLQYYATLSLLTMTI